MFSKQRVINCVLSLQRPRKVGARYTGTGIAPDEHAQVQLSLDYDGKRDRWNGYDPEEHQRIVEEYAKVDLVSLQEEVKLLLNVTFVLKTRQLKEIVCSEEQLYKVTSYMN